MQNLKLLTSVGGYLKVTVVGLESWLGQVPLTARGSSLSVYF